MLSKENRLKKKKDFDRVWKKGRGPRIGSLLLKTLPNNLNTTRFAFVVGLKVSKKAVVRNKLKRRLREIVRARLPKIKPGMDVIIVALGGLENKKFYEIKKTMSALLKKAKIITNPN